MDDIKDSIKDLKKEAQKFGENGGRSSKWILYGLGGCFGLSLLCILCLGGAVAFGIRSMKSSDVYLESVQSAKNDPRVQDALGTPIEEGIFLSGSISTENGVGTAELEIPLSGPNQSATLFVEAESIGDSWDYFVLTVQTDGEEVIDLLKR